MSVSRSCIINLIILVCIFSIISCGDDRENLLQQYLTIHCAYTGKVTQRDSVVKKEIKPLEKRLHQLKEEQYALSDNYDSKIAALQDKITATQNEYEKQYAIISTKHEAAFGHKITSEYERQIALIEAPKQKAEAVYNLQISELSAAKEADGSIHQKEVVIKQVEQQLQQAKESVHQHYELQIKEEQQQLAIINKELDELYHNLSANEKKSLTATREKLKATHCKP